VYSFRLTYIKRKLICVQNDCTHWFLLCFMNEPKPVMNANVNSSKFNLRESYFLLLQQPQWQTRRKAIIERDNNKCRCCGGTKGLQVHHRQYHFNQRTQSFINPWLYADQYLVTLCTDCHKAGHSKYTVPVFNINPKY
jgi:5-methylcytosine-specific restriction endonuclease McrA